MKVKCRVCGQEFEGAKHSLYCSEPCRIKALEANAKKHIGEVWQGMEIKDMSVRGSKEYATLNCAVCGKPFTCRYDALQRGQKSCGCDQSKPWQISDVIGKKYGMLTPVKAVGSGKKGILYRCKCDCGRETTAYASALRYGDVTSCGCKNQTRFKNADREAWGWVDGTNKRSLEHGTINKNNTSGARGVSWNTSNKGWIVRITYKTKTYHLGTFRRDEMDVAIKVRKEAEKAVLEDHFEAWIAAYREKR